MSGLVNNQNLFIAVITAIVVIAFIIFTIINTFISIKYVKSKKNAENNTNKNKEINADIDVIEAKNLMLFFDNLLKTKFNYYLINEILPIYSAGKKLDKTQIKEIQKDYFVDVSALINKQFKKTFLKYFTSPGLELYINEQFIYFLNKFDSMSSFENNNIDEKSIHNTLK